MAENIVKRPYSEMGDFEKVYDFILDNFTLDCAHGCYPTFFEYSLATPWSDNPQNHRFAIWEEDGKVVAFCWFESGLGQAYFNLADGYDELIPEMIEHAEKRLRNKDGKLELQIFAAQKNVAAVAEKCGYVLTDRSMDGLLYFDDTKLDYELPKGYSFVEPLKYDVQKMMEMCWRGFNHTEPIIYGEEACYHMRTAPHATPELDVLIQNDAGEYVCYAGMWLVPKIKLAYMEPLCTVPEARGKGLARAALTEMYRKTSKLGAKYMTGGDKGFYYSIGYKDGYEFLTYKKEL